MGKPVWLKRALAAYAAALFAFRRATCSQSNLSEEEIGAGCSLPPQSRVTKQVMRHWAPHVAAEEADAVPMIPHRFRRSVPDDKIVNQAFAMLKEAHVAGMRQQGRDVAAAKHLVLAIANHQR